MVLAVCGYLSVRGVSVGLLGLFVGFWDKLITGFLGVLGGFLEGFYRSLSGLWELFGNFWGRFSIGFSGMLASFSRNSWCIFGFFEAD